MFYYIQDGLSQERAAVWLDFADADGEVASSCYIHIEERFLVGYKSWWKRVPVGYKPGWKTPNLGQSNVIDTPGQLIRHSIRHNIETSDPHAVMESFKANIRFILPRIFGYRTCGDCPRYIQTDTPIYLYICRTSI